MHFEYSYLFLLVLRAAGMPVAHLLYHKCAHHLIHAGVHATKLHHAHKFIRWAIPEVAMLAALVALHLLTEGHEGGGAAAHE